MRSPISVRHNKKSVVIEYHQQPDANAIGQHTTDSIEFGDGDDGKRNKQKQPEQIEAIQSGTDQQEVYKTIPFDGKQQVGLHFLGGCFWKGRRIRKSSTRTNINPEFIT